ncbi:monocarboxylate transporter 7-like [Pollicipes pollicipes]|uniref:monocarboxylate transporter 7-like n=1 Tax=Pollicipes pollicipes TaxID=41117 RepID=UPI0018857DBE|nr:monocarboxylate transporter 7-like [Pollicipes pollicipes]
MRAPCHPLDARRVASTNPASTTTPPTRDISPLEGIGTEFAEVAALTCPFTLNLCIPEDDGTEPTRLTLPDARLALELSPREDAAAEISRDPQLKLGLSPSEGQAQLVSIGAVSASVRPKRRSPAPAGATPSEPTSLSELGRLDVNVSSSLVRRPRFLVRPALNTCQLKYALDETAYRAETTRLAPPDGGWGWVVLAGSMTINILIPGFIKSFGVLFDDVCAQFDVTPATAAWIPALSFFMYNFMGLVGGALCQKYSCRVTSTLGGLLASAGLLVSYCADHIYYLYLGMGLMGGGGGCFAYSSGVLVVGSYFERRRGLANGLCVSGSALGAMIFPPALDLLLEHSGFSDAMLLLCAVLLHVVPCAALYQPVEWHMVRVSAVADEASRGSVHSLCYLSTVLHGSSLAVSQKEGSHQIIEAAIRRPAQPRRPLIELTLLCNPVFLLIITSSALFQN